MSIAIVVMCSNQASQERATQTTQHKYNFSLKFQTFDFYTMAVIV